MPNTIRIPSAEEVVEYLRQQEPGKLAYPVFLQAARLLTQATVEMVPLRRNAMGKTEVLLTQRPAGDLWEHKWHVPGTILLPSDPVTHPKDYDAPFRRLIGEGGELKSGVKVVHGPVEVSTERRVTRRGHELSVIHWVEVEGQPAAGTFFDAHKLHSEVPAPGVIEHHQDFIPRAVAHFESTIANRA